MGIKSGRATPCLNIHPLKFFQEVNAMSYGGNIIEEGAISLSAATREFPTIDGRTPSPCSVWRYARVGLGGVRLPYVRVGRRICTSRPAVHWFCAAVAAADETPRSFSGRRQATTAK